MKPGTCINQSKINLQLTKLFSDIGFFSRNPQSLVLDKMIAVVTMIIITGKCVCHKPDSAVSK